MRFLFALIVGFVLTGCGVAVAQAPADRARAVVEALASGDPGRFEAAAQAHYAPETLAQRTPAQRAALVARLHGDFGATTIVGVRAEGDGVRVDTRGETGMAGVFEAAFDAAGRIARLSIAVEAAGGQDAGAPLPAPAINGAMSAEQMAQALDTWTAPFIASDQFAGVIAIAREGRPVVSRAYGLADRERGAAANVDTAYNLASIGKIFTKTAIARLIQEGRLARETTLGDVIPDYPNVEARAATIVQLLEMQGGIADFFGPVFRDAPKSQFVSNHAYYTFVSSQPQRFAPGARREYCNGCYVVLGEIIERVTGMAYEDYIQRTVFEPAGMTHSGFFRSDRLPANTARRYGQPEGASAPVDVANLLGVAGSAAGGSYANAADMLAFDSALRGGRLLNAEMTAWVLESDARRDGRFVAQLGLAGGAPGTSAIMESDGLWTVIVLANADPQAPERMGQELARALAR